MKWSGLTYGSLFSGVECASVALVPRGWQPQFFCENAKFPSAVLKCRFPDVPNLGDITKVSNQTWESYRGLHMVIGGSPCTSFSTAGEKEGIHGESGRLMFEWLRAVRHIRPAWVVWENVKGALSVDGGQAFGQLITTLDELGYVGAWRVFDSEFFSVAQRRERVFVVGCVGTLGVDPGQVLFEPESFGRDYPPSRTARKTFAARDRNADPGPGGGVAPAGRVWAFNWYNSVTGSSPQPDSELAGTLKASWNVPAVARQALLLDVSRPGRDPQIVSGGLCSTLQGHMSRTPLLVDTAHHHRPAAVGNPATDPSPTLQAHRSGGNDKLPLLILGDATANPAVGVDVAGTILSHAAHEPPSTIGGSDWDPRRLVRRLTPLECERLQGLPDGWTNVPWRGKPYATDCRRYEAIGNGFTTTVVGWIAARIEMVGGPPWAHNRHNQGKARRVRRILANGAVEEFPSVGQAAKQTGVNKGTLRSALRSGSTGLDGSRWEYVTPQPPGPVTAAAKAGVADRISQLGRLVPAVIALAGDGPLDHREVAAMTGLSADRVGELLPMVLDMMSMAALSD